MKSLSIAGGATWWFLGAIVLVVLLAVFGKFRGADDTENDSPLIRADFSDDAAWETLCRLAQAPYEDGFRAYLRCVDERQYEGMNAQRIVALKKRIRNQSFAFIADKRALEDPEHPILVVDLGAEPGRSFRVIPSQMWSIENNLSIANMDWEDFEDELGADRVYRGIPND